MKTQTLSSPRKHSQLFKGLFLFAALACFVSLSPVAAHCADVTLAWDANSEADLAGYILYYGTSSGNYPTNMDVGNRTQHTIPGLQEGVTYYFAVTAYNLDDFESDYSTELAYTVGASASSNSPHVIVATAGANGSMVPSGDVTVDDGSGRTFSISAAVNYHVRDVLVDGISVGAVSSYTFSNVTQNHTIAASFVPNNQAPNADAGSDLTVNEGVSVTLNGSASSDLGGSIASYAWEQTDGLTVQLANAGSATANFTAPYVAIAGETLTFRLTVTDADGLSDIDTCVVEVTKTVVVDSDGDGVPDNRDDFPYDPAETLDTDGDGEGNNADTDDDNDGMPDDWELAYGLNPLIDDAGSDPDRDEVSNINEFNLGTAPNHSEGNFKPDTPVLLSPENSAMVSLTPQLKTGDFYDPNVNDVHGKTQWIIIRAFDDFRVFDVTTKTSLTSITVPNHILEEDSEYIWKVRFIDNHETASEWSAEKEFITAAADYDADKNGVPDVQEVAETQDLDEDGNVDIDQPDIKCVNLEDGETQICVSIRDAENAVSIVSLSAQDPNDLESVSQNNGQPNYFEFGLLDFKVLVNNPGDETVVTIYLSKAAYNKGNCFKYDPVNDAWLDYSDYTHFSPNRKEVYLTLKDGGFGDADGLENGIIVDPLAFGSESNPNNGSSESPIDKIFDGIIPNDLSCFISTAAAPRSEDQESRSLWREIRGRELAIIFIVIFIVYLGKIVFSGVRRNGKIA